MSSRKQPPGRPALSVTRLREIAQEHRKDAVVVELLWEIRRLHGLVVNFEHTREAVARQWHDEVGSKLIGLEMLRMELLDEPAVVAWKADQHERSKRSA